MKTAVCSTKFKGNIMKICLNTRHQILASYHQSPEDSCSPGGKDSHYLSNTHLTNNIIPIYETTVTTRGLTCSKIKFLSTTFFSMAATRMQFHIPQCRKLNWVTLFFKTDSVVKAPLQTPAILRVNQYNP